MAEPSPPRVLVVDDEAGMRKSLAIMLRREAYAVSEAAGGTEALDQLGREVFDLIVADLNMDDLSGLEVLRHVKQANPDVEVIMMTAYGTIESAVEAMKLGAFDFITKPFQPEEILLRVRNAVDKRQLRREVHRLRAEAQNASGLERIVGVSEPMRRLLASVPRVGQTDSTVLVTGESGTGKELIAHAIHATSRRAQGPFVSVSCAALPEHLLENELFGHVKGAFTGALAARKGLLEDAHGGTFFLDEVGEAPLAIQVKLLRVLEERSIRRLGDNRSLPVDIRVVAATNRDLDVAVGEKTFREDLLYRLNVIRLHLPPLRERSDDVPLLARHFLAMHCRQLASDLEGFSPDALAVLAGYPFPGNVRELSNVIEQAVALAAGPLIELDDLPERVRRGQSPAARLTPPTATMSSSPLEDALEGVEQEQIREALRVTGWNISQAATRLGVSRNTLRYRIEKYGLRP
ncbi:MAG TPA: sigma-54 dependent transcriptional regulator [Candidatus Acidoferrum sp.]|nr:sigma-54 dependent transcriptional regulator [Candidatus Acidoferrum sp.]